MLPHAVVDHHNALVDDALTFLPIVHEADSLADPEDRRRALEGLGSEILRRNRQIITPRVTNQGFPIQRAIGGRWFDEFGWSPAALDAVATRAALMYRAPRGRARSDLGEGGAGALSRDRPPHPDDRAALGRWSCSCTHRSRSMPRPATAIEAARPGARDHRAEHGPPPVRPERPGRRSRTRRSTGSRGSRRSVTICTSTGLIGDEPPRCGPASSTRSRSATASCARSTSSTARAAR